MYHFTRSNGRRDYRTSDLRDKLDRRHSPHRRYSPGRDARDRHAFYDQKPVSFDREYSLSKSPVRRSERHRNKQQVDGESDVSGSFKASDDVEYQIKERKVSSHGDKKFLEEQLRQASLDIEMLDDHKCQLEVSMEEKAHEVDKLSSKIEELERQLSIEQENGKRVMSKIKKFTKAHNCYLHVQEELKRSQGRFQRLGDQFCSDSSKPIIYVEDSSVNIVSDEEPKNDNLMNPKIELRNRVSPVKKRSWINREASEEANSVKLHETKRSLVVTNIAHQSNNDPKTTRVAYTTLFRNSTNIGPADAKKQKHGRNRSPNMIYSNKYQGDDEDVDVDKVDTETIDIDLNSEVDIDQI